MKQLSYWVNIAANFQVRLCCWALVVLGIAMTLIILIQVFCRFVVYIPVPWSEEAARYLMVWMGMLGSVAAWRQGRHIGVRVLVERLPGRLYDFIAPFVHLTVIAFLGVLFWQGVELAAVNADQLSPAMEISMLVPYISIPLGAAMMILDVLADLLHDRWPTDAGSSANIAASALLDSSTACAAPGEE